MWHLDMPEEYRNHIVIGDARELAKRIPDESVDLVLTDPPFGLGYKYDSTFIDNPETYSDLICWTVTESNRVIKPKGLCFVFVATPRLREIWPLFPDDSRIFAACKNFVQMRPTAVQYSYDPVIFWQKGKGIIEHKGRDWHVGNTACTNNRGDNKVEFHTCPRPLETILYMVENWCPFDGIVLDWFMGSGTTAVAAKRLGRNWLGFEIDVETTQKANWRVDKTQVSMFHRRELLQPQAMF